MLCRPAAVVRGDAGRHRRVRAAPGAVRARHVHQHVRVVRVRVRPRLAAGGRRALRGRGRVRGARRVRARRVPQPARLLRVPLPGGVRRHAQWQ